MTTITRPTKYASTPRVQRFNAWFFRAFDGFIHFSLRRLKQKVYRDLPETVVEIGPGVGANFRYYRLGTRVIAFEPNREMHPALAENAARHGLHLEIHTELAEDTGLADDSVDAVVSNLVLCTVVDPEAAVAEAKRILRPGGRLLMVEHVRGLGPVLRGLQRLVHRPWQWLFEGCDVSRDTAALVRDAGFSSVNIEERAMFTAFLPVNAWLFGDAVK